MDIFQRKDLKGWAKALWVVAIFVIPWLGVLAYLIARPPEAAGAMATGPSVEYGLTPMTTRPASTAQELERLANLRSEGFLTEEEYSSAKASVISANQPGTKAA